MGKKLVRKCCMCKTIEIGDFLIHEGDYNKEDYDYTDTFLSDECLKKYYEREGLDFQKSKGHCDYVSCRTGEKFKK